MDFWASKLCFAASQYSIDWQHEDYE